MAKLNEEEIQKRMHSINSAWVLKGKFIHREFIFKDYRSGNGVEMQGKEVKAHNLYRQNYCGCMFGLNAQREQQDKLTDELIYPIGQQIQPESIEERLELYQRRNELEDCNIIKQRFLNYRLLSAKVILNKEVILLFN